MPCSLSNSTISCTRALCVLDQLVAAVNGRPVRLRKSTRILALSRSSLSAPKFESASQMSSMPPSIRRSKSLRMRGEAVLVHLGADRARAPLAERAAERAAARGLVRDRLVFGMAVLVAQLDRVERARQNVELLHARALGRAHERAVFGQERQALHRVPLLARAAVEPLGERDLALAEHDHVDAVGVQIVFGALHVRAAGDHGHAPGRSRAGA